MITEKQILLLNELPKVGRKTIFKIGLETGEHEYDLETFKIFLVEWCAKNKLAHINLEAIEEAQKKSESIIERSAHSHIHILGYWNQAFPDSLRSIAEPPVMLFVAGDLGLLANKKAVAVIGTREPSDFGKKAGRRISELLALDGFTIISGLAKGCDTAGHRGCLDVHGKTIAVLAHGLDMVYPNENTDLAFEIVRNGGALVSEYPIGKKPLGSFFVERDRLQSGLSAGIVVIETDIKGGTMHTVRFTEDSKKPIACLKHPESAADFAKANGNRMLISEGRALGLATPNDIYNFIDIVCEKADLPIRAHDSISATLFPVDSYMIAAEPEAEYVKKKTKKPRKKKGEASQQVALVWE